MDCGGKCVDWGATYCTCPPETLRGSSTVEQRPVKAEAGGSNPPPGAIKKASKLLGQYLSEFPEHDQGDFRVWQAKQLLDGDKTWL